MAMTNAELIAIEEGLLIADGLMEEDEQLHTYARWKAIGFKVKKGEKAIAIFDVWKPCKVKVKDKDGKETGEIQKKLFMVKSAFFKTSQVERI